MGDSGLRQPRERAAAARYRMGVSIKLILFSGLLVVAEDGGQGGRSGGQEVDLQINCLMSATAHNTYSGEAMARVEVGIRNHSLPDPIFQYCSYMYGISISPVSHKFLAS